MIRNLLYESKIKTALNNLIILNIKIEDQKLLVNCTFKKEFKKITFSNSFTIQQLKNNSDYFSQFETTEVVLKEIIGYDKKGEEFILGNEEYSNDIKLIIPTTSTNNSRIIFSLNKKIKTPKFKEKEKDNVIVCYRTVAKILNLNSKILINKDIEAFTLKSFIAPNKRVESKLLYSFYYDPFNKKKNENLNSFSNILYKEVNKFHQACDNRSNILLLCKSNKEIFGGFTPLSFDSSSGYKKDANSFLFSLNKFKKYPKDSIKNTRSIYCHKNYGPCFYDDLEFIEFRMNIIDLHQKNYMTEDNWVDKENCYKNEKDKIKLDSLEIFQIFEFDYSFVELDDEEEEDNDIHINNINNNTINNINNINISNINMNNSFNSYNNINNIRQGIDEININKPKNELISNKAKNKIGNNINNIFDNSKANDLKSKLINMIDEIDRLNENNEDSINEINITKTEKSLFSQEDSKLDNQKQEQKTFNEFLNNLKDI